jgi:hypothetical protein
MENNIIKVIEKSNLEENTAINIRTAFSDYFEDANEAIKKCKDIKVINDDDIENMALAKEYRIKLKNIRVAADKKRKALKEDSNKYGKAVQGVYNVIDYIVSPMEKYLKSQEDYVEIKKATERQERYEKRMKILEEYEGFYPELSYLTIDDRSFQTVLEGVKAAKRDHENKILEEEKERVRVEKETKLRYDRTSDISLLSQYVENYIDIDFGIITQQEYETIKDKAIEVKERYDKEQEALRVEREKVEAENRKKEKQLEKEKQARFELEREKQEHEERLRKEKQIEEERLRKEKNASDKEKIYKYISDIESISLPEIKEQAVKGILKEFNQDIINTISKIKISLSNI